MYMFVCIYICITQCVVIYSQNSVWVESQGGTKRQVVVCFLCTTRAHGGFSICSVGGPRSLIFPGSTTEELKNAEIWMWIQNSLNKVEGLGNLNENLLTHTHAYVYVVICTYKRVYRDMYIYIYYIINMHTHVCITRNLWIELSRWPTATRPTQWVHRVSCKLRCLHPQVFFDWMWASALTEIVGLFFGTF